MLTTFGSLARRNGVNWADKPAFIALERQVTWGELDQRSDALGHAYRALGVMPGDRVAILTHDAIEVPECFLAAAKIGAIRVWPQSTPGRARDRGLDRGLRAGAAYLCR